MTRNCKIVFNVLFLFLWSSGLYFLSGCEGSGGHYHNTYSSGNSSSTRTVVKSGGRSLLGRVFPILNAWDVIAEALRLLNEETRECQCFYDFSYLVVTTDRRQGVTIYVDEIYAGEVKNGQAFVKVLSPGRHQVYAVDNQRKNRIWSEGVITERGGISALAVPKSDWEKASPTVPSNNERYYSKPPDKNTTGNSSYYTEPSRKEKRQEKRDERRERKGK